MRQQLRSVGSSLPCSPDGTSSSAAYLTRPYLQVSVNEAAAQICRLVPAMLTRLDELISSTDTLTSPYLQVSVNEAAAQICRLVPAMLTRRDELFPLARQVVRDSGYQYSKGHSRYCIFVYCCLLCLFCQFWGSGFAWSSTMLSDLDPHLKHVDPYKI